MRLRISLLRELQGGQFDFDFTQPRLTLFRFPKLSTALQPLYGRLYRINLKWPFVSCIVIFEIGSIICAAAQSSTTFIVGRGEFREGISE